MRPTGQPNSRLLGYVHVQVASRVFVLPVEARSLTLDDGSVLQPGFFGNHEGSFGILVDGDAPEAVVKETIEHASVDAARHIGRSVLN
jgi:hypothetical protein